MLGTLKNLGIERLEVKIEPILWPNIMEPLTMQILRECGAGARWENKNEWDVMWLWLSYPVMWLRKATSSSLAP